MPGQGVGHRGRALVGRERWPWPCLVRGDCLVVRGVPGGRGGGRGVSSPKGSFLS